MACPRPKAWRKISARIAGGYGMNTIARAKGLLVEPGKTWDGIAAEPMTLGGVSMGST